MALLRGFFETFEIKTRIHNITAKATLNCSNDDWLSEKKDTLKQVGSSINEVYWVL
jgi:hypothetical protein